MKHQRLTIATMAGLAGVLLVVMLMWSGEVQAQSPTPTVQPIRTSSGNYTSDHTWLSGQIHQGAEFSLYSYENSLVTIDKINSLTSQISDVYTLVMSNSQPVTLTVIFPEFPVGDQVYTRTLPSGFSYQVNQRYDYGQAAIIILLIGLLLVQGIRFVFDVTRAK